MRAYEANFRNRFGRGSARSERLCRLYTEVPERTEKAGVTEPHQGQLPDEPGKGTGLGKGNWLDRTG